MKPAKKNQYIPIIQKPSLLTINLQWNAWKTTLQTFSLASAFPPSDVSAPASTGHCSDTLSEKWCLSPIIGPASMCFTRTSPHHCICVYIMFIFNCGISSWALYSSLLFSYKTTRSRNHSNWSQNCPSFCWITRWSLALSYWMESSPAELSFSESDWTVHTGWKEEVHCAPSNAITWGNRSSRLQPSLSGRLKCPLFHSVQFYFFSKFHSPVCFNASSND